MPKFKVNLTAHGNIDHDEDPYELLFEGTGYADTIESCQQIVRDWIEETEIGGGNWTGGQVYDTATGKEIGYISYNGRYWEGGYKK